MTEPGSEVRDARAQTVLWRVGGIDLDFNCIDARRHDGLSVASVEHEVLSAEFEDVGIGPAGTDPLEAVRGQAAAASICPAPVAGVRVERIRVEHAESAL